MGADSSTNTKKKNITTQNILLGGGGGVGSGGARGGEVKGGGREEVLSSHQNSLRTQNLPKCQKTYLSPFSFQVCSHPNPHLKSYYSYTRANYYEQQ